MVVGDDIHAIAVLGLDEQHSGHEFTVGPWAILRCDRRGCAGADGLIGVDRDDLCGLGNQPFVGIQEVGAHSRGDGLSLFVAVLLFPDAPVHWVVAVARNGVSSAVLHFDQPVVAVVLVAGGLGAFGLLRAVAIGVVGVADGAAVRAGALQQAMVLVVLPGPAAGAAVGDAVGQQIQAKGFCVSAKQSTGVGGYARQAQFVVVVIAAGAGAAGAIDAVGAPLGFDFVALAVTVDQVQGGWLRGRRGVRRALPVFFRFAAGGGGGRGGGEPFVPVYADVALTRDADQFEFAMCAVAVANGCAIGPGQFGFLARLAVFVGVGQAVAAAGRVGVVDGFAGFAACVIVGQGGA